MDTASKQASKPDRSEGREDIEEAKNLYNFIDIGQQPAAAAASPIIIDIYIMDHQILS